MGRVRSGSETAEAIVREFWELMGSNDFTSVASVLAPDFTLDWPQSGERIRGAERFAAVNAEYPAHGKWRFDIVRLFGNASEIVSEVAVTDGTVKARAISLFTVVNGKILRIVEFWPEEYPAPANRKHFVEPIE